MRHSWTASWQRFFSNRGYGIRHSSVRDRIVGTGIVVGLLGTLAGAFLLLGWLVGR